jgi:AraC-like DNA-binding protein
MHKPQSLTEFYQHKLQRVPEPLPPGLGHFNVFSLDEFVGPHAKQLPFSRKDFYKIMLISGHSRFHYADKSVEFTSSALLFANPQIPYAWEPLADSHQGYFCIFTAAFFDDFGRLTDYPVFQPGGQAVVVLNPAQVAQSSALFQRMLAENSSDYAYKQDVLRTLVFELVHEILRLQPAGLVEGSGSNAPRVANLFLDLLERQFPIESSQQRVRLRAPLAFASQLAVHVNHLNQAVKNRTGKTTSQAIAARVIQEARALLHHTNWTVSEIAWCLGFDELPPFIRFFKKNTAHTPLSFRRLVQV